MRVYALYGGQRFVLFLYILIMGATVIISSVRVYSTSSPRLSYWKFSFQWSLTVGMKEEPRRDVNLPIGCGPNMTHYLWVKLLLYHALFIHHSILAPYVRVHDFSIKVKLEQCVTLYQVVPSRGDACWSSIFLFSQWQSTNPSRYLAYEGQVWSVYFFEMVSCAIWIIKIISKLFFRCHLFWVRIQDRTDR